MQSFKNSKKKDKISGSNRKKDLLKRIDILDKKKKTKNQAQ